MLETATIGTELRRDSGRSRDGSDVASWPRLLVPTSPRPPTEQETLSRSFRELRVLPDEPEIPGAGEDEDTATPGSRVLTGLALVAMGGLMLLASAGYSWAVDLARGAWPLFIIVVGFSTVMIVTDRDDVVGKLSVVAGLAILFAARFELIPEATLRTLGPWAFVVVGLAIALSAVELRGRRADQDKHPPAGHLPWDEPVAVGADRGEVPEADASAPRAYIHDAQFSADSARKPRPRLTTCSRCRALAESQGHPNRARSRTEALPKLA